MFWYGFLLLLLLLNLNPRRLPNSQNRIRGEDQQAETVPFCFKNAFSPPPGWLYFQILYISIRLRVSDTQNRQCRCCQENALSYKDTSLEFGLFERVDATRLPPSGSFQQRNTFELREASQQINIRLRGFCTHFQKILMQHFIQKWSKNSYFTVVL